MPDVAGRPRSPNSDDRSTDISISERGVTNTVNANDGTIEVNGRRYCVNPKCRAIIGSEFVLQVTTVHHRWFCSIECAKESQQAHYDKLADEVRQEMREGKLY